MGPSLPYSEACERNQNPIFAVLQEAFVSCRTVLEIGSGTGQHAVSFARRLPHLTWIATDLPENHWGISAWLTHSELPNTQGPLALQVTDPEWPVTRVDAVFSANTLHIMSWEDVQAMFRGIGRVLSDGGMLVVYGPFNMGGQYTSESNARFDAFLKARDPLSGIRDIEAVEALARSEGLTLQQQHALPANNRALVWRRTDGSVRTP